MVDTGGMVGSMVLLFTSDYKGKNIQCVIIEYGVCHTVLKIPITQVRKDIANPSFQRVSSHEWMLDFTNTFLSPTELHACFLFSVSVVVETCGPYPVGRGSSVCSTFPLPTPAALSPKAVLEVAQGSSAHAQGRLQVPGSEPSFLLPTGPATFNQGLVGVGIYSRFSFGWDTSEACVLYHLLSSPRAGTQVAHADGWLGNTVFFSPSYPPSSTRGSGTSHINPPHSNPGPTVCFGATVCNLRPLRTSLSVFSNLAFLK